MAERRSGQRIAIPAYFAPGAYWAQVETGYPTVGLAVVNPDSGPGNRPDVSYSRQIAQTTSQGVQVLGYISTSYGRRSAKTVKAQVDAYNEWYGVSGIFFDEVCSRSGVQPYYANLYGYVKTRSEGTVVLNPGANGISESYMTVSDIIVTFEGAYNHYVPQLSEENYSPHRFWHLIYGAHSARTMEHAIRLSTERGVGWIYVTPDGHPNPWDTLPPESYWSKELFAAGGSRRPKAP